MSGNKCRYVAYNISDTAATVSNIMESELPTSNTFNMGRFSALSAIIWFRTGQHSRELLVPSCTVLNWVPGGFVIHFSPDLPLDLHIFIVPHLTTAVTIGVLRDRGQACGWTSHSYNNTEVLTRCYSTYVTPATRRPKGCTGCALQLSGVLFCSLLSNLTPFPGPS